MRHFLHYWAPPRAALAFDGRADPVASLESGWFKRLEAGDTLWVLSRGPAGLILILRSTAATNSREISVHPKYAIRNSSLFSNHRVTFTERTVTAPFAVPLPRSVLDQLRFHGASERAKGTLRDILQGPLGSLRELQQDSVPHLDAVWDRRAGHEWLKILVQQAGETVFATAAHRSRVERSAIRAVKRRFESEGWRVTSKERDKIGYDLHCARSSGELHVEVKGTVGDEEVFFLTAGEERRATADPLFRIAVVTRALDTPRVVVRTNAQMRRAFRLSPIAYSAVRSG